MKQGFPDVWRFLKVDLFDNASIEELKEGKQRLKLAFSIQGHADKNGEWRKFRSAMNSPRKCFKRGVQDDWDWNHYKAVLSDYDELNQMRKDGEIERVNVSKVYQYGWAEAKHTISEFSTILWRDPEGWHTIIYFLDTRIYLPLNTKGITERSRSAGIIASNTMGGNINYKRKRAEDLF